MLKNNVFFSKIATILVVFLVILGINSFSVQEALAASSWQINYATNTFDIIKLVYGLISPDSATKEAENKVIKEQSRLENLVNACVAVESEGNPNAVGDNGRAVGILQIWKITIDDVNRILGYQAYSYDDRYSPEKSKEIFEIYVEYYGGIYRQTTGLEPTDETYARIWNGGPKGWRKDSTDYYWYKVNGELADQAEASEKLAKN